MFVTDFLHTNFISTRQTIVIKSLD